MDAFPRAGSSPGSVRPCRPAGESTSSHAFWPTSPIQRSPSRGRTRSATGCALRAPRSPGGIRSCRRTGCRRNPVRSHRDGLGPPVSPTSMRSILPRSTSGFCARSAGRRPNRRHPFRRRDSRSGPKTTQPPLWFAYGCRTNRSRCGLRSSACCSADLRRCSARRSCCPTSRCSSRRSRPLPMNSGENARPSSPCSPPDADLSREIEIGRREQAAVLDDPDPAGLLDDEETGRVTRRVRQEQRLAQILSTGA